MTTIDGRRWREDAGGWRVVEAQAIYDGGPGAIDRYIADELGLTDETYHAEHLADLIDSQTARGFVLARAGRIDGPTNWRSAVRREVAISNIFETA